MKVQNAWTHSKDFFLSELKISTSILNDVLSKEKLVSLTYIWMSNVVNLCFFWDYHKKLSSSSFQQILKMFIFFECFFSIGMPWFQVYWNGKFWEFFGINVCDRSPRSKLRPWIQHQPNHQPGAGFKGYPTYLTMGR